jgi:hypothetical protein
MKKILLILLCLCCVTSLLFSQSWELTKTRSFKANDLYGYINGGSEIFLELGFKELKVEYYSNGKSELVFEKYEMETAESALGIYLQKCGNEVPVSQVKTRNTGDRYQITCLKGNYFIVINNPSGDKQFIPDMVKIINSGLEKIKDDKPIDFLAWFDKTNMIKSSLTIFRGMYSLQTIYTFGEGDILLQRGKIFGAAVEYKNSPSNYFVLIVRYPSKSLATGAFNNLMSRLDNTKKVIDKKSNYFAFQDHANKFGVAKLNDEVLRLEIHLTKIK